MPSALPGLARVWDSATASESHRFRSIADRARGRGAAPARSQRVQRARWRPVAGRTTPRQYPMPAGDKPFGYRNRWADWTTAKRRDRSRRPRKGHWTCCSQQSSPSQELDMASSACWSSSCLCCSSSGWSDRRGATAPHRPTRNCGSPLTALSLVPRCGTDARCRRQRWPSSIRQRSHSTSIVRARASDDEATQVRVPVSSDTRGLGSDKRTTRGGSMAAAFALDAGIMAVELPTAFPSFGAIAAIIASSTSLGPAWRSSSPTTSRSSCRSSRSSSCAWPRATRPPIGYTTSARGSHTTRERSWRALLGAGGVALIAYGILR